MTASKNLHQFKRKKPLYKSRFFWISIAALIVIVGLFYLIAFASFFEVERIEVSGNQEVDGEAVKKIVRENITRDLPFSSSRSIFLARTWKARSDLVETFPVLCGAEIRRNLPDGLKVKVKEREPVGIFVSDKNYLIDKRGVAFQATSSEEGFLLKKKVENLKTGEEVIPQETMQKVLTIKSRLEEIDLKSATLTDSRLNVVTEAGWRIYFDLSKDWEWQVTKLKLAMEREISETEWKDLNYIDLRFDKIYYK